MYMLRSKDECSISSYSLLLLRTNSNRQDFSIYAVTSINRLIITQEPIRGCFLNKFLIGSIVCVLLRDTAYFELL